MKNNKKNLDEIRKQSFGLILCILFLVTMAIPLKGYLNQTIFQFFLFMSFVGTLSLFLYWIAAKKEAKIKEMTEQILMASTVIAAIFIYKTKAQ